MACSSTPTLGDFSTLLARNLMEIEQQQQFDLSSVFAPYRMHFSSEYDWMKGCINTYGKLACDETAMYVGILTLISAVSGSAYYVDESSKKERPINLYVHLIGEPGTGKSTPINYIKTAMCQLIELFPDIYNKKVNINNKVIKMTHDMVSNINDNNIQLDIINKKNSHPNDNIKKRCEERVSVIVNFDTELALFRQMSLVGDLFAITDELDSQLVRLGVFKSNEDASVPGSKLLTQAYDGIQNESRGTGAAKLVITNAKLAVFGASTGQRYTSNMRSFACNLGNDGVLVRMSYLVMPHRRPKVLCNKLPISMPNALHIATIVSLMVNIGYPIQFRFEKLQCDLDNEPEEPLPLYQRERRSFVDGDMLPSTYELVSTENTSTKRRTIDIEEDGSTLSAYALLEKLIQQDSAKADDLNRPQHVRSLYAKTGYKLTRIVANTHLYFLAIHLLTSNKYELFNYVSFREGSGTANSINGLSNKFLEKATTIVHNFMKNHYKSETYKVGETEIIQEKFVLDVTKESVLSGYQLFKYMQDVQLAIFDLSSLDSVIKTRLTNSSKKIEEARCDMIVSMVKRQDSDTALIFKLPSPILKRVWITNKRDAPSWAGIFCQSSKKSSHSKTTERGTNAIDKLLEHGLIEQNQFLPKNSGLWKLSPMEITQSICLTDAVYDLVGINIQEYEQLYEEWCYPSDLTFITNSLIDHLIHHPNIYAKYYHNYAPEKFTDLRSRIEKLEHERVIEKFKVNGKDQWKFIHHENPTNREANENSNTYLMNQIETCEFEQISSNEQGLKRKLTKLVRTNEVIISPSSSFVLTPSKRTHLEKETMASFDNGINIRLENLLSPSNNTILTSSNETSHVQQVNTNNIANNIYPVTTTKTNASGASTTGFINISSKNSTNNALNSASNITPLSLSNTKSSIAVTSPDLVAVLETMNCLESVFSPMNVGDVESSPVPVCKTDKNLHELVEITSSPIYSSDLVELTERISADVPSITSFFDNLSTDKRTAASLNDMEEQMDTSDTIDGTNVLTFSPILSASVPTYMPASNQNYTADLSNDLINIDKNLNIAEKPLNHHLTISPFRISTNSSTPIQTTIELNSNTSSALAYSNSFDTGTMMPSTTNVPKVKFLSNCTDIPNGYTESSIEITYRSTDIVPENVHSDIPPDGPKDKNWNPGKDGIDNWSKERIISYLNEKRSKIYKIILTGNWGVCATKSTISKILSKQYSGLGAGALCRLDSDGLVKLQPIYAYMDGDKYKIAHGYVKMVPDDSGTNRRIFMSKLAEYEVTVASYLESFIDRSKIKYDPSCNKPFIYTLTRENNINASTYFFSPLFKEIIESYTLYKERLQVDISSVLSNPYKDRPVYMISKAKDAYLLEQEHLRKKASKKIMSQLGEPPAVKSKLRSGKSQQQQSYN